MACYVDRLIDYTGRVSYRHKVWCHLVADSDDELLACADAIGLSAAWMQGSRRWDTHFDLPAPLRPSARELGAIEVDFRFMGRRTRARRTALGMGTDGAVGAPIGQTVEVPLPPGRWEVTGRPAEVEIGWRSDHPMLPGRPVVTLSAPGELAAVVTFAPAADAAGEPVGSAPDFRLGVVLTSTARGRVGTRPTGR